MPASFAGVSATFFSSAVAMISASDCSAAEPVIRWRAEPTLQLAISSTSCGHQHKEPIKIEFDGKVLKTAAWSGQTYDIILLEPLNADGSGEVNAVAQPKNRSMIVRFDPGHGPRNVTWWGRYYSGMGMSAKCIYTFVPLEG